MATQNPFDVLYQNRPELVFHESLRYSKSAMELAELARSKGYAVSLSSGGGFVNDIQLHEGFDHRAPVRSHSIRSARRFLEAHPGVS